MIAFSLSFRSKVIGGPPIFSSEIANPCVCSDFPFIFTKEVFVILSDFGEMQVGGRNIRVGGMAKGSGMIHPNMATMLGVRLCFLPVLFCKVNILIPLS